ncbi:EamA family transporter, partial [bacterium]|nr:EamA family transporter [bacterium]
MTMERPSKARVFAAYAAVYIIWGSTYLAIRYAIETIPPFMMMGARSILAGSVLFVWSRKSGTRVSREEWLPLVIVAILFFVLGHGLLAWAQKSVASGLAAVLIASDPLWIAVIESLAIKEFRLRGRQILGLMIGFAGIVLLFAPDQSVKINTTGAAIILLSAISWSVGAVYS